MRTASILLLASLIFRGVATVRATTVDFYEDGTIQAGDRYDTVNVWDKAAVEMTGGYVDFPGMFTYDSSIVNVSDGEIEFLHMHDSSTVSIFGGIVATFAESLNVYQYSTLNIFGGFIGTESVSEFMIYDSSVVNIQMQGGWIGGFTFARNSSTVNVYSGDIDTMGAEDRSTVNIYGGDVGSEWGFSARSSASVNIYGYDFYYNPKAVEVLPDQWLSKLSGQGLYGTPINIWGIPDPATHPNIRLIPEPSGLSLIAMGGFVVLRKRLRREVPSK